MYLTRYFLRELSSWLLFTPLVLSFAFLIGFSIGFSIIFIFVISSCMVIFLKYNELRKQYLTTFTLAPIPRKTMVQVDFAFFSWITGCYFIYALVASNCLSLLITKEWVLPTFGQLCFLLGCFLCFITLFIWLMAQKTVPVNVVLAAIYVTMPLSPFLIRSEVFASLYGIYILCGAVAFAAISYVGLAMLANKRLVIS